MIVMELFVVVVGDSLVKDGNGAILYFPSRYDAGQRAASFDGAEVMSVSERRAKVD